MVEMYSAERVVRTRKPNRMKTTREPPRRAGSGAWFNRVNRMGTQARDTTAVITLGMPRQINPSRISSPLPQPQTTTHVPPKTVLAFD